MSSLGCGSSLFGPGGQYIKTNAGDIVATDGANVREKLMLSDMRIPYKQILKSRVVLKPGQVNYLMNHLGMGDNATFLSMRATYDKKSVYEEDNYVEYSYYDDLVKIHSFGQVLVLTGNSKNRIKQLYLNNPNQKYPVSIDIMVAVIDDSYSFFNDFVNQTATTFTGLEHTDIQTNVVCQSLVVYDKSEPKRPLVYFNINDISTVERNGQVVLVNDSLKEVVLKFINEDEAILGINLLNYIIDHPCVEISPTIITDPTSPGKDSVIMYQFAHSYMNPADETTYYIGNSPTAPALTNTNASTRVKSMVTGQATQVTLATQITGQLGSTQSQSFILSNYTTGITASISASYSHVYNSQNNNFLISPPLHINKDDEMEILWVTPAFDIEPTLVSHSAIVYIEY
jgi:hypothetical protein